jgi:hypothetical protein
MKKIIFAALLASVGQAMACAIVHPSNQAAVRARIHAAAVEETRALMLNADMIFIGSLRDIKRSQESVGTEKETYTFRVDESLKGVQQETVETSISRPTGSTMVQISCGTPVSWDRYEFDHKDLRSKFLVYLKDGTMRRVRLLGRPETLELEEELRILR